MQGLVHYSDDSSPEQSTSSNQAGPSRLRNDITSDPLASSSYTNKSKIRSAPNGIVLTPKSPKRQRRTSPQISSSDTSTPKHNQLPENLTHTAQSDISKTELSNSKDQIGSSKFGIEFQGLNEDEIFNLVTLPPNIDGLENWGIPPEVDPNECDDTLKKKVEHFLKLKYENNEHINTRLLSSSSFANPHIYSKLVEFVSIDERSTNFPSNGWLTRRNLEELIPQYGPKTLSDNQKAKQEAVKAAQAISGGKREITFAPGKHKDEPRKRDRNGWEKDDTKYRHTGHRNKERDRDRERYKDRDRKRDRR
ncbi:uncharacterized protein L201_006413 [Kwoniella dendrophila CBS 6074]|uniref:HCNGP-domain-containing protein n=1 Tax=Kwoniella dendrophila CBS 6074 TaxID=1295534 RepID=A0AAX4K3M1_9TREE